MDIKGGEMAPLFRWLSDKKYNHVNNAEVGWDFIKFLIDEKGNLVSVFEPTTHANSQEVITAIEK